MSGSHYDYAYQHIESLADDIERELKKDFRYETDWSEDGIYDQLADVPDEETREKVKACSSKLIKKLRKISRQAKALEWYFSGDTGYNDFLEEMGIKNV